MEVVISFINDRRIIEEFIVPEGMRIHGFEESLKQRSICDCIVEFQDNRGQLHESAGCRTTNKKCGKRRRLDRAISTKYDKQWVIDTFE